MNLKDLSNFNVDMVDNKHAADFSAASHTHNEYAAKSHGNHVPAIQTANNAIYLRNDNTWQTITPAEIGAAPASHGTHVTYGGNGSASTVSRSDHTHSNYLPLGGGTLTGRLTLSSAGLTFPTTGGSWISGKTTASVINATNNSSGSYHPIIRYAMNSGNVANLGAINNQIGFWGFLSGTTENRTDAHAYLDVSNGTFYAGKFAGPLSGNASTATTLATARTINGTSFNGSSNITTANWGTTRTLTIGTTGKSVNGSGNVSWSLSEIGAAAASHSHNYLPLTGGTVTGNLTVNGSLSVGGSSVKKDNYHTTKSIVDGGSTVIINMGTLNSKSGNYLVQLDFNPNPGGSSVYRCSYTCIVGHAVMWDGSKIVQRLSLTKIASSGSDPGGWQVKWSTTNTADKAWGAGGDPQLLFTRMSNTTSSKMAIEANIIRIQDL